MTQSPNPLAGQVALITGAAHRIGAHIARGLHAEGMDLVLHYRRSAGAAEALKGELEETRPDSVLTLQADLHHVELFPRLIAQIDQWRGRLDLLVNNASTFYRTPLERATEEQWEDLLGINLKAPFFLARHAATLLRASNGAVINLVDIDGGSYTLSVTGGSYQLLSRDVSEWEDGWTVSPELYCEVEQR